MTVEGIDLSSYQATTPDLSGLGFMVARASIGLRTDGAYAQHVVQARRKAIVVGAYHFAINSYSMTDQADLFTHAAGDVEFYVIDVEGSAAPSVVQTARFIARVKANKPGKPVGLYMSQSGFYTTGTGADFAWVAKWASTPPSIPWRIWQYTSSGSIAGYTGRLDLNRYNGSISELRAWVGEGATIPDTSTAGATVDTFFDVLTERTIPLNDGAKVYAASDLTGTPIVVSPGRTFSYVGSLAGGPRIIVWAPRAGDTATYPVKTGYTGFVARTDAGSPSVAVDPTPFTQADIDAAVAAALAGHTTTQADITAAVAAEDARIRGVLGI